MGIYYGNQLVSPVSFVSEGPTETIKTKVYYGIADTELTDPIATVTGVINNTVYLSIDPSSFNLNIGDIISFYDEEGTPADVVHRAIQEMSVSDTEALVKLSGAPVNDTLIPEESLVYRDIGFEREFKKITNETKFNCNWVNGMVKSFYPQTNNFSSASISGSSYQPGIILSFYYNGAWTVLNREYNYNTIDGKLGLIGDPILAEDMPKGTLIVINPLV